MNIRAPYSFVVLVLSIAGMLLSIGGSAVLAKMEVSPRYAGWFVLFQVIIFSALASGIYAGVRYKSDEPRLTRLNKIGLIGNITLYAGGILLLASALWWRTKAIV